MRLVMKKYSSSKTSSISTNERPRQSSRSVHRYKGVISVFDGIVAKHGIPCHIRQNNGPEFISHALASLVKEMVVTL